MFFTRLARPTDFTARVGGIGETDRDELREEFPEPCILDPKERFILKNYCESTDLSFLLKKIY
jgi:hypothetical protein